MMVFDLAQSAALGDICVDRFKETIGRPSEPGEGSRRRERPWSRARVPGDGRGAMGAGDGHGGRAKDRSCSGRREITCNYASQLSLNKK